MNDIVDDCTRKLISTDIGQFFIINDGTAHFKRCKVNSLSFVVPPSIIYNDKTYYITKLKGKCFKSSVINILLFHDDSHVYSIGNYIFIGSKINYVAFPKSLKVIKNRSFLGYLNELEQKLIIDIHPDNKWFVSVFGSIYTKTLPRSFLFSSPSKFHVCIRESIERVGRWAFFSHTKVTSLTLPKSLRIIDKDAFCSCDTLQMIRIPRNVEIIGPYAFEDCFNLKKIVFEEPSKIKVLPKYVFHGCSSLKRVNIPESVELMEKNTFSYLEMISIKNQKSFVIDVTECSYTRDIICKVPVTTNLVFIGAIQSDIVSFNVIKV